MNIYDKLHILQLWNRGMIIYLKQTLFFIFFGIMAILITGADPSPVRAGQPESMSGYYALENRVKRLEDREEIRRLLLDYGRFLDQGDFRSFSELFAKTEGEWIGGMGRARGVKAIRELMESTIGKNESTGQSCHIFTNEAIQIDGDRASAVTRWIFVVAGEGNSPRLYFVGHYKDSLLRENGRWKFLRRVVHADIPADDQIDSNQ